MNPIFDLIVIGIIVSMVWLNLYLSKKPSPPTISFWSTLKQKLTIFNSLEPKTAFAHFASSQD